MFFGGSLNIGKEWNETVLVNIGGKSSWDKHYVPMVIHHESYEFAIYFFIMVVIIILIYNIFKDWRKM